MMRKIFQVASSCPIEAFYLESGCIPLGIMIKSRRINYLHHLATRREEEMLTKVFMTQWNYPSGKNEWSEQVKDNMRSFGLNPSLEWIITKSKLSFKALVKRQARELALLELNMKKDGHSKMDDLDYSEMSMQMYLKDPKMKVSEARTIFWFRTRNFKGEDPLNCV